MLIFGVYRHQDNIRQNLHMRVSSLAPLYSGLESVFGKLGPQENAASLCGW